MKRRKKKLLRRFMKLKRLFVIWSEVCMNLGNGKYSFIQKRAFLFSGTLSLFFRKYRFPLLFSELFFYSYSCVNGNDCCR